MLSIRSNYFKAMLSGGMLESSQSTISLDVSSEAFREVFRTAIESNLQVLKFIYSGKVDINGDTCSGNIPLAFLIGKNYLLFQMNMIWDISSWRANCILSKELIMKMLSGISEKHELVLIFKYLSSSYYLSSSQAKELLLSIHGKKLFLHFKYLNDC